MPMGMQLQWVVYSLYNNVDMYDDITIFKIMREFIISYIVSCNGKLFARFNNNINTARRRRSNSNSYAYC